MLWVGYNGYYCLDQMLGVVEFVLVLMILAYVVGNRIVGCIVVGIEGVVGE